MTRVCPQCSKPFESTDSRKVYCCSRCSDAVQRERTAPFHKGLTPSNAGCAAELMVAATLMFEGWSVFQSAGPNGPVDIVAFRNGVTRLLECRTGRPKRDGSLSFPRNLHKGFPQPTEFAVYVPSTGDVRFFPVQ